MRYLFLFIFLCPTALLLQAQDTAYYRVPLDTNMPLSLAGNFGEPRENHFHSGIDFRVGGQPGAKLYAVADGYISRISITPSGYGNAVYITHPNGTTSVYAHLHTFPAKIKNYIEKIQYRKQRFSVNETIDSTVFSVKKGQVIGIAGNSGNSFGAHLHFEIRETTTDKTLNTVKSGIFKMEDNIPPQFHNVVFYSYKTALDIPDIVPFFVSAEAAMNDPVEVSDTFFVAADVNDRQNGPSGILGVNRLVVTLDEEVIFAYRMDDFLFDDSRYINSLYAYDWWTAHHRPLIKTYVEPGNNLLYIYDRVAGDGLITLPDDDIHILKITAYDDVNNRSQRTFKVKKAPSFPKETAVDDIDKPVAAKRFPMYHNRSNVFQENGVKVTVPEGSLYRPIWFTVDTLPRPDEACSAYWHIHSNETPLHRPAQLHLSANVPASLQAKAVIARQNSKGKISSAGGSWQEDGVTTDISTFGDYFVLLDTVPPIVEPQFTKNANLTKAEKLSVKISDDMSGIKSYRITVDGQWALAEYDAKEDVLHYFFNPKYITRNATHTLVVTVSDKRNNISIRETSFRW